MGADPALVGSRAAPGLAEPADHVVWVEGSEPAVAARSGDLVLLYHLLWELTHVVFEHPGLLTAEPACTEEVCITCSDEGRVVEVRAVHDRRRAEVVVAGRRDRSTSAWSTRSGQAIWSWSTPAWP